MTDIRERLADYAHRAWAGWMNYMFEHVGTRNADGTVTLPAESVERWDRQRGTPYEFLPEKEKGSDRAEADKVLEILADGTDETRLHEIAGAWKVFRRTTVGIPYSPEFAKAKADLDRMLEVEDG